MRARSCFVLIALGACGGGGISVRGELADGFPAVDRVLAVEAGRDAAVRDGRFELKELGAAPISLRLLAGSDTVAWIELADAPAGVVALEGLRLDPASRRAFPARVGGTPLLTVNGVRIGGVPDRVDAEGVVLGAASDGSALLFRTAARGPDLRVAVDEQTLVLTRDGDPVEGWTARGGDSLRVEGATREGVVRAARLTLPPEPELPAESGPEPEPVARPGPEPAAPPRELIDSDEDRRRGPPGKGRGRGRGKAKGRG